MIIKNLHQYRTQQTTIVHGSLTFLKISNHHTLSTLVDTPDALIIEDPRLLQQVRNDPQWYLTPIFTDGFEHHLSDGNYTPEQSGILCQKVQGLSAEITKHQSNPLPSKQEDYLLIKTLRYIASRKTNIKPSTNRSSMIGYHHHHITFGSGERDALSAVHQLQKWQADGYLKAQPIDKVNLCYDCSGSYLNFVEACPKCNSIDLKNEELVHHFRCAYIGPQSDYEKDGQLICPKCAKTLKHIGIDYDKPSEIHDCQQCSYTGQETTMKAGCVDCGKENTLDQIQTLPINAYSITEKGLHLALATNLQGQESTKQTDANNDILPQKIFELIRSHEIKKQQDINSKNYDLTLTVNQSVLSTLHGNRQTQLLYEVASIIRSYVKDYDIMTITRENNIQILLLRYNAQMVEEIQSVIVYNINKMMKDNSWTTESFITATIQPA